MKRIDQMQALQRTNLLAITNREEISIVSSEKSTLSALDEAELGPRELARRIFQQPVESTTQIKPYDKGQAIMEANRKTCEILGLAADLN